MLFEEKSYWFFIVGYIAVTAVFIWWLEQLEHNYIAGLIALPQRQKMRKTDYAVRAVVSIVLVLLCVFGIRGRTGYNPIKISEAYYCNDAFLNQLGINPAFNLITSVIDDMRKENKELSLMPYNEAIAFTRTTYGIGGKVDSMDVMKRTVVNKPTLAQRPNVVIILMESMSASLMKEFGQQQPLTPTLDSLYQHSLAFTNFYSAGIHTNHGMTATLYRLPGPDVPQPDERHRDAPSEGTAHRAEAVGLRQHVLHDTRGTIRQHEGVFLDQWLQRDLLTGELP